MTDSDRRFTLRRLQRLRSSREFAAIYEAGRRAGDRHLLVFAGKNDLGWSRYGLSVSKKHGNAVCRNRLRRLLRESFRLSQHEVPGGYDFILIPRQSSNATLDDYCRSLVMLCRRIVSRSAETGPGGDDGRSTSGRQRGRRKRGRGRSPATPAAPPPPAKSTPPAKSPPPEPGKAGPATGEA